MVWTYQRSFIEIAIVLTEIAILNTDNKGRTNLKKKIFWRKFFFSTRSTTQQAGRRHGWSLHNCILVIQFLTDRAENFWQRLIIVRIKAWKPIFDFRKNNFFRIFQNFKVLLLGNGGVHSNGAQKHTTRCWYEPTCQVSSKSVDSSGLQSCPLHTYRQTEKLRIRVVSQRHPTSR